MLCAEDKQTNYWRGSEQSDLDVDSADFSSIESIGQYKSHEAQALTHTWLCLYQWLEEQDIRQEDNRGRKWTIRN